MKHESVSFIKMDDFFSQSNAKSVNNEIVAYTVGMHPLTKKQFVEEINEARKEGIIGNVISDEDLQKEIETW